MIGLALLVGLGVAIGMMLLFVPGLILATIFIVAAPALIVEKVGVIQAIQRSVALTRNHRWAMFGIIVVYFVASMIIGAIETLVFTGSVGLAAMAALQNPGPVFGLVMAAIQTVLVMISTVAVAAIYFELRRIKEGVGITEIASGLRLKVTSTEALGSIVLVAFAPAEEQPVLEMLAQRGIVRPQESAIVFPVSLGPIDLAADARRHRFDRRRLRRAQHLLQHLQLLDAVDGELRGIEGEDRAADGSARRGRAAARGFGAFSTQVPATSRRAASWSRLNSGNSTKTAAPDDADSTIQASTSGPARTRKLTGR